MSPVSRETKDWLNVRLSRAVVTLRFDHPRELDQKAPGTGVLLSADTGVVAILTANHVVDDVAEPRQVLTADGRVLDDPYSHIARFEEADVALLLLEHEVSRELAVDALPISCVASRVDVIEGQHVMTLAFPEQMTSVRHVGPGNRWSRSHVAMVYSTSRYGVEPDTLWFMWETADVDAKTFPFDSLDMPATETIALQKPIGLSGAPVFLIDSSITVGVVPKLVGVATDFTRGREHASPCWNWRDWLLGTMEAARHR